MPVKWIWLFSTAAMLSAVPWFEFDQALSDPHHAVCSMSPFTGFNSPYETFFLATTLADTVSAADDQPPFERLDLPPGPSRRFHSGPVLPHTDREPVLSDAETFGQLVLVSRYGGYGLDTLDAVLDQGGTEAVLVPWSYDPACQVVPWTGSFVWSAPGEVGLFKAWMRAPDRWAGGRPTFDVRSTTHTPYPHAFWFELRADRIKNWLSPRELFELLDARPARSDAPKTPVPDISRLQAWRHKHPDLLGFYPVPSILKAAFGETEARRVYGLESPVAGTYAVHVEHGGRVDTLFVRTSLSPTTVSWADRPSSREVPEEPWRSNGHYLAMSGAADTADIQPLANTPPAGACQHRAILRISESPSVHGDSFVWSAEIEPFLLSKCLGGITELAAWDRALEGRWARGSPPYLGRFLRESGGAMRFEQEWLGGQSEVRVTGVRVSSETLDYRMRNSP